MKIKTSELQGAALDWAVAKCEGMIIEIRPAGTCGRPLYVLAAKEGYTPWTWEPSTNWSYAGPIIEREGLCLNYDPFSKRWNCSTKVLDSYQAETPLIAAMRCYVASKLGDEVEIPEGLV
jgi:hypothetical protein